MFEGIAQFNYTRTMPQDAVAIAQVTAPVATPAQLVNINNTPYLSASLGVWLSTTSTSAPPDFVAQEYNQQLQITGSTTYNIDNQFFDLTNISNGGVVYWYVHVLPSYATGSPTITDLSGNITTCSYYVLSGCIYHNFFTNPMYVIYTDSNGYVHTDLLQASQVLTQNPNQVGSNTYTLVGRQLTLPTNGTYYIRFTQAAGFLALSPWNDQLNTPWYAKVSYPLNPFPTEWANQIFAPSSPYMAASFVPGQVLSSNIIEFERKDVYPYSTGTFPDIIVLNSDYSVKYALDGSPSGTPKKKGNLYPWQRGAITSLDNHTARVMVSVDLDLTDIVYGFYEYKELNIIYRDIDLNPFTNQIVKGNIVQLFVKTAGVSGLNSIFYNVVNSVGSVLQTNDPAPGSGSPVIFCTIQSGTAVSTNFTIEDIRVRGGGLLPQYQIPPISYSCWDTGFWDAKPYPVAGAMLVYLPVSIQSTFDTTTIQNLIQQTVPAGTYPLIKFYASDGTESV